MNSARKQILSPYPMLHLFRTPFSLTEHGDTFEEKHDLVQGKIGPGHDGTPKHELKCGQFLHAALSIETVE